MPMLRFTADSGAASWVVLVLLVPPWALGAAWLVSQAQRALVGAVAVELPLGHGLLVGLVGDDHEQDVGADVAAGLGLGGGQPGVDRREGGGRVGPLAEREANSPHTER